MNIFNRISLKTLKKNRSRTIVTIIGVILSVSMITAVTTLISSLQFNLIEQSIEQGGDWHLSIDGLNNDSINDLKNTKEVESLEIINGMGYAKINDKDGRARPYIFVSSISKGIIDKMPFKLISGRLPETDSEIMVTNNLLGKIDDTRLGSNITLDIGIRNLDGIGEQLWQNSSYLDGEESLIDCKKHTFDIVGICETSVMNGYDVPGYPVFTVQDESDNVSTAYIKLQDTSKVFEFGNRYSNEYDVDYNSGLLRFSGVSDNNRFNIVLYSLGGILVCIIMGGSILLIYNAFAISVSERTKQFGLLSSIGATKKQLSRTVIYEACFVSMIGIPIGLIAGITGIAIALYLVGDAFAALDINGGMIIHFSPVSICISIIVSFITVLISAYIPSRRVTKCSAIEAIRQNEDIKINPKKIKSSKYIYKLFGLQGSLAEKNFKRNRKQYRSTIISLFVSIVLFISASTFTMYLSKGIGEVVSSSNCDIIYYNNKEEGQVRQKVYPLLANVDGITDTCVYYIEYFRSNLPSKYLSDIYKTFSTTDNDDEGQIDANIYIIDDASYNTYVKKLGLTDYDITRGIAINKFKVIVDGKYYTGKIIDKEEPLKMNFIDRDNNTFNLDIGYYTDIIPMALSHCYDKDLAIVFPESARNSVFGDLDCFKNSIMSMNAENPKEVIPKLNKIIAENGLDYDNLYNIAESETDNRNLMLVINVFSYGFIILISLIAVANVFNTVTTNFNLRKREFAMLKSVGMSQKEFYKMIRFECAFYGLKAVIWGLPISILFVYAIYRSVGVGYEVAFSLPWVSMIISVFSVFIVVFSSMIYAINKAKSKNIIDVLKNDNI